MLLATVAQGATIQFQVTDLGGSAFHYDYFASGFSLQANQQIDIRFDPALYSNLSNGSAGAGFSVLLFQPDNPPGTFGDYTALALVNNPSLAGAFGVDLLFKGLGTPGAQTFFIDQFDPQGNFMSTTALAFTAPRAGATVPEPGSFWLGGLALGLGGAGRILRRRLHNTVPHDIGC